MLTAPALPALLVVDDDPTIRAMFARALRDIARVEVAASGGEAMRFLATQAFDLILLDLHMPVIDGFVVLQMLASKPGPNHATPVYVVSADTSDSARVQALKRHAVFFLTKPVPIGTLVALVDMALKKKNAHKAQGAAAAATPTPSPVEAGQGSAHAGAGAPQARTAAPLKPRG